MVQKDLSRYPDFVRVGAGSRARWRRRASQGAVADNHNQNQVKGEDGGGGSSSEEEEEIASPYRQRDKDTLNKRNTKEQSDFELSAKDWLCLSPYSSVRRPDLRRPEGEREREDGGGADLQRHRVEAPGDQGPLGVGHTEHIRHAARGQEVRQGSRAGPGGPHPVGQAATAAAAAAGPQGHQAGGGAGSG